MYGVVCLPIIFWKIFYFHILWASVHTVSRVLLNHSLDNIKKLFTQRDTIIFEDACMGSSTQLTMSSWRGSVCRICLRENHEYFWLFKDIWRTNIVNITYHLQRFVSSTSDDNRIQFASENVAKEQCKRLIHDIPARIPEISYNIITCIFNKNLIVLAVQNLTALVHVQHLCMQH